jgi:hypothetical protein
MVMEPCPLSSATWWWGLEAELVEKGMDTSQFAGGNPRIELHHGG